MRLIASFLLLLLPAFAQEKQDDKAKKAPAGPPTNLKVLKVTSRAEVGQHWRHLGLTGRHSHHHPTGGQPRAELRHLGA